MGVERPWVNPDLYAMLRLWAQQDYLSIRRHVHPEKADWCYMGAGFGLFHVTDSVFAKAAIETARHIPEFSSTSDEERNSSVAVSILAQFACKLVEAAPREFNPLVFDHLYADLEHYLFRWEEFAFTSTVDICNVDLGEVGPVEFEDAVLRPMTSFDIERRAPAWKSQRVSPFVEDGEPLPMAILERRNVMGNRTQPEHKAFILYGGGTYSFGIDSDAEKLLLALRLTAPGTVWRGPRKVFFDSSLFDSFNSSDDSDEGFYTRHNLAGLFEPQEREPLATFILTPPMVEHIRWLLPLLDGHTLNNKELRLPVRRFSRSFRYDNPEDRFIDLWVGLESLTSDRDYGFTPRMYKRISVLTQPDEATWTTTQPQVRESYGIRSDILHGRSASAAEIATYWDQTEEYLRRIINLALEQERRFSDEELDELVARFDQATAGR